MSISEIIEQAKSLSPAERRELIDKLLALGEQPKKKQPKTGAEIVAMLEAMDEPIEFVDPHIENPVEWVKAQRRKRQEKLQSYRDDEQ